MASKKTLQERSPRRASGRWIARNWPWIAIIGVAAAALVSWLLTVLWTLP